jgi:hypothetical protein
LPASGGTPQDPNHPAPPVAALADTTPHGASRAKRQPRDPQGRRQAVHVRVTEDEWARIKARADAAGISPPRLLVELALLGPAGASERNAAKTALLGVRRQIIGVATNINQLARWANAREQLPPGLASSLAAVERMEAQLGEVLQALGAQP